MKIFNIVRLQRIIFVSLLGSGFHSLPAAAEVWSTVRDTVITNNGVYNCTDCHNTASIGNAVARHAAPDSVNFDGASDLTAYANATAVSTYLGAQPDDGSVTGGVIFNFVDSTIDRIYEWAAQRVNAGNMPMDPTAVDFTDAADLNATKKATILNWALQGAPYAAPTAVTDDNPTLITKTSATVQGDFNTNVHAGTAVPGTYYFEYGTSVSYGASTSVSNRSATTALSNTTKSISGLACGTLYHYRARATNGSATGGSAAAGVDRTLTTLACTDPVIAGVSLVADATTQSTNEDTSKDFALTVSDDDPGGLQWSKTNGTNGSVSLISPTSTAFNGSATVRYSPVTDYYGPDAFTVTVNNMNTGTSRTITFNMTISAVNNDAPVITQGASTTVSMSEDGNPTPFSLTLNVTDVDDPAASTVFAWEISQAATDGVASVSGTGASKAIAYTPLANDNGNPADNFKVRVWDGGSVGVGNSDEISVSLNISAQPDSPVANNDNNTAANGTLLVIEGATNHLITVVANDTDADAGETATLVPTNVVVTAGGLTGVTVVGNQIRVSHDGSEELSAQLTYQALDTTARTSTSATVDITIVGVNDPPTAADPVADNADEGGSVTIDLPGLSTDPELAGLSVVNLTQPANGSAVIIASGPDAGKVLYTHDGTDVPAAGTTTDTFTYQISDGANTSANTGTVTITLAHVNDLPVAVADSISVAEGGTVTVLVNGPGNTSVLDNDTDEENGTGTGFSVSSSSLPALASMFALNSLDGTFVYTHNSSENFSDSFTYSVSDGTDNSASPATVSITITPVNDAPSITSSAPTIVFIEETATFSYQLTQSDVDDTAFTYMLTSPLAGDTPAGDMDVSATGLISWTPPRTGIFNNVSSAVTVTVTDADSATAGANKLSANQVFTVITSPLDSDSDGVADYSDNCPTIANAGQEDMDGDTVHLPVDSSGIPASGDVDATARDPANSLAESYLKGGDACDEDVDGDGISRAFEDSVAYLSDTNAADAALDKDGDGISNLDEFLAGTDPAVDSVGPVVIAPADVTVTATGHLTRVDIGIASAGDGNDGNITGIVPIVDTSITDCKKLSSYPMRVPAFRPGAHVVNWTTCDKAGNLAFDTQHVNVKPILNTSSGQSVGEAQIAVVKVMLNGPAAQYPVTVNYQAVAGSAGSADHDASSGTITINQTDIQGNNPGVVGLLNINIIDDGLIEGSESFRVVLSNASNAVLGAVKSHLISIVESDSIPILDLVVKQGSPTAVPTGHAIYADQGGVELVVTTTDTRPATLPSFDWSMTDNALNPTATNITNTATTSTLMFDPSSLAPGNYPVVVEVTDNGLTTRATLLLKVSSTSGVVLSAGIDTDGDGDIDGDGIIDIDDVAEGIFDSDSDGIPDYLDNSKTPANVIENQTGDLPNSYVLETDPGLRIALGATAIVSGATGVLVSQQNIDEHGGQAGGAGIATADSYSNIGGYYDFEITGLNDMLRTARVVIPMQSALLSGAEYRKYHGSAWSSFVEDGQNSISSAKGELGVCPSPGSIEYTPGLTAFNFCVQLMIEDGGPNDADATRDFVIRDPGGVALPPEAALPVVSADGRIGVIHPAQLLVLVVIPLWIYRRRYRQ